MFKHNRTNLDKDLTPYIKINSKWVISLRVYCKPTTLLEENKDKIDGTLCLVVRLWIQHQKHNPRKKNQIHWALLNSGMSAL